MTSEILRAAQARIDTPANWMHIHDGRICNPDGECALVALNEALEDDPGWLRDPAVVALIRAAGLSCDWEIPPWNDSHTHAEVMAAFDRAIADAEAAEQEFTAESTREPVTV
jgi:hypothetical protein